VRFSAKALAERLEKLEAANVLAKRVVPPPSGAQIYELSEWAMVPSR
jgi:DNA-binding HxlR family transcriptional regulator